MSFAFGSKTQRRLILDRVRAQLSETADADFLSSLPFSSSDGPLQNWNQAYDYLNDRFWNGNLPKISVTTTHQKKSYGLYYHSGRIELASNKGLSALELLGVLLHEMCHHYVEVTFRHGVNAANGGKRVIGHGKEWKAEMRRVGYSGKVTRFSGKERFLNS